jgi:hypothetical protein
MRAWALAAVAMAPKVTSGLLSSDLVALAMALSGLAMMASRADLLAHSVDVENLACGVM